MDGLLVPTSLENTARGLKKSWKRHEEIMKIRAFR
jgi:hypothetical protein